MRCASGEVGKLLGTGSYKKVYAIENVSDKVLVTLPVKEKKQLVAELEMLKVLGNAAIRVVKTYGGIQDIDKDTVGIEMEAMSGTEVKARNFGMNATKNAIVTAAKKFGFDAVISQLQAVHDYVEKKGGIIDLQFWVSEENGVVLFDPLSLNANTNHPELKTMISHLEKMKKQDE